MHQTSNTSDVTLYLLVLMPPRKS